MKILGRNLSELESAGRWDIDFHLPPEGIKKYPKNILKRVDQVASVSKNKKDPSKLGQDLFRYIDISCVDVEVGMVTEPQELAGDEAPSRARKLVKGFDILVSTCRPTRGAIAVVPLRYHNEIASTGFSIVRANSDVNPFYLHFALRLPSTLEQFRKWSTGSSYPAILDEDVAKTLIPIPEPETQDQIASTIIHSLEVRQKEILRINQSWQQTVQKMSSSLMSQKSSTEPTGLPEFEYFESNARSIKDIQAILQSLDSQEIEQNVAST